MSILSGLASWWLPALLALIGGVMFVNGNKSQSTKMRNAGVGVVLLAIVWTLLICFIDTDKNKVERGTRQLVQDVVDGNWPKFQSKLTPSAIFATNGQTVASGSDLIVKFAKAGAESVQLKTAHVQNLVIEQTGTLIAVRCDIFTTQDAIASMETSSWQFDWEMTGEGWKVREMRLLTLKGVEGDQLRDVIPKPR